ncbi:hypothetical protein SAMN03159390_03704 [Pseudomonas sp. NFACC49-2]|uniref:DUF5677 domain-containing protein n=1 Tax=Pseudomonas sp. NFACC49-2 TaxID=1566222 RepID=UPI000916A49E|nr:DUF5677 domain-containing protein [Pseudomonas sp. NFACC49-2]SFY08154.1 hypothetical protein SAMN03159390_03704 [Pseudomonas sp. NFACC49-2]
MDNYSRKEHFIIPHLEHRRHLPELENLQHQIDKELRSISLDGAGEFKFATKICCHTTADIISELNIAILQSLRIGSYSAAEALSRSSLENSINLILFSQDPTTSRPKSILLNYLKTSKMRAQKWHRYAKENNNVESIERSINFQQSLDAMKGLFEELDSKTVKGWPDAYSRFRDAGFEHFYHILFAPASDSIHGFSNDIFNRFLGEKLPVSEEERREYFEGQLAEKISFAYYLATNSILFFCAAVSYIADRAENEKASEILQLVAQTLETMILEHEVLTKTCLDTLNPAKDSLKGSSKSPLEKSKFTP